LLYSLIKIICIKLLFFSLHSLSVNTIFVLMCVKSIRLTSRHNLNLITWNKVFENVTFLNQLQTLCSFLFENPINLSTVIGWLSKVRMQCRRVGRTDGRPHTESDKNVSNKSSSLQVGSENGTIVQLCISIGSLR